jgi:hypothetical protein
MEVLDLHAILLEGAQVGPFLRIWPYFTPSSNPFVNAFGSLQQCGGLNFWHEVLRIVELLLVWSFVLVDDILEDGLNAGIDLTWWPITGAMSRQAGSLPTFAWTRDLCSSPLIFGWEEMALSAEQYTLVTGLASASF